MADAAAMTIDQEESSESVSTYKSFPKGDPRRYFVILEAMARLKDKATLHYIALDIGATRAEVERAIESMPSRFDVEIEKIGSAYRLRSWGVLKQRRVEALLLK